MEHFIPEGDVLVHAGDFTNVGELNQVKDFNTWLGNLPHKDKVIIAGNHDWSFYDSRAKEAKKLITNAIYLEDSSIVIDNIKLILLVIINYL